MIFANYHTHTTFCDGRDTPERLVQEAIRLGCPALGFSGHSYAFYDAACMPKENIRPYQAEIRRLQSAYSSASSRNITAMSRPRPTTMSSVPSTTCGTAANTAQSTIRASG